MLQTTALTFCTSAKPDWQVEAACSRPVQSSLCSFVCSKIVQTRCFENYWTDFDANCCKWSAGSEMKRSTLGLGGQRSRWHEAEDRLGGLAEAPFSTPFSRVAFLAPVRSWRTKQQQSLFAMKNININTKDANSILNRSLCTCFSL